MKYFFTLAFLVSFLIQSHAQLVSIATARAAATGATVTVRGIVLNGSEFGGSTRYIQDPTGGLALYSSTLSSVLRGDSIEVTGIVAPYNNLFELNPVSTFNVISSGNPLPTPIALSIPSVFIEQYEGMLVQVNGISFSGSGAFAGNQNYTITDGSNTAQVRINACVNTNLCSV